MDLSLNLSGRQKLAEEDCLFSFSNLSHIEDPQLNRASLLRPATRHYLIRACRLLWLPSCAESLSAADLTILPTAGR